MKKLAGRDFEDILQVRAVPSSSLDCVLTYFSFSSVGSQSSKASCQTRNITASYSILPLIWPPGMPMRNSAYTRHTQLHLFGRRQKNLAVCCVSMPTSYALSMLRNCCRGRLPPHIAARLRTSRNPLPLLKSPRNHQTRAFPKALVSTSRHTRSTRRGTTRITLNSSVQQTVSPQATYVPHLYPKPHH